MQESDGCDPPTKKYNVPKSARVRRESLLDEQKARDGLLYRDVRRRLRSDPLVEDANIEVIVSNSRVTLGGRVRSRREKWRAEESVHDLAGVDFIQNIMSVGDDENDAWPMGSTEAQDRR